MLEEVECIYETLPGFDEDLSGMTDFAQLPENAQNYVRRLSEILETPISMIGVGPGPRAGAGSTAIKSKHVSSIHTDSTNSQRDR